MGGKVLEKKTHNCNNNKKRIIGRKQKRQVTSTVAASLAL